MNDQQPVPPQPPQSGQPGDTPQGQNSGAQQPVPPVQNPQQPTPPAAQPSPAPQPAAPQVPADPNNRVGQLSQRDGNIFIIPPHPNTQFDENYFLALLEGSISLTMEEKQRVIDAIPRLSIEQINELISIFEEEKQKFSELEKEFADDVAKLKAEREKEIEMTETKKEEESEADADAAAAEALKRQMMGGDDQPQQ